MMDRDRYRQRARDLHGCAQLVKDLTKMPDRATEKDFRQAADLMTGAANDIDELIKSKPAGCICRRIEDDNYSYLDYAEGCLHHHELRRIREELKMSYAKMECALKDEVRMRLIVAALSSIGPDGFRDYNKSAHHVLDCADEVLRLIVREGT
jgi:hypothetical protein